MKKFYKITAFTQYLVEMASTGAVVQPSQCRCVGGLFFVEDKPKVSDESLRWKRKRVVVGHSIIAASVFDYVDAVNNAVAAGFKVMYGRANLIGFAMSVPLVTQQQAGTDVDTSMEKEEATNVFDIAHAESLGAEGKFKTKTDAKFALKTYAEMFGVNLDVNKKFENMIKDLKAYRGITEDTGVNDDQNSDNEAGTDV